MIITLLGFFLLPLPTFHPWPSILISSFGLFLLIQSFTLRLEITPEALVVLQLGRELRRFPFKEWLAWRIFLPWLPGILYFRETASPHLLPLIFNVEMLEAELRKKVEGNNVGCWIELGDTTTFVEKIRYLISNPKEAQAMGKRARNLLVDEYSIAVSGKKYYDVLKKGFDTL